MPGLNGLVIMKPTSISSTVGTSSIGTDGKVTFSLCESISLNGVFTSSYDNYTISCNEIGPTSGLTLLYLRMRASGVDSTINYTYQSLLAQNTSLGSSRTISDKWEFGYININARGGQTVYIFGPALAQPTVNIVKSHWNATNNNQIQDYVYSHNVSSSYDGFTLSGLAGRAFSGNLYVYGFNQ